MLSKKNKSGRSMLEMLGVIAIGALAVVATMNLFSSSSSRVKITKTFYNISEVSDMARTLYWGKSDYTGIDMTKLISAGLEEALSKDGFANDMTIAAEGKGFSIKVALGTASDDDVENCYIIEARTIDGAEVLTPSECAKGNVTFVFQNGASVGGIDS